MSKAAESKKETKMCPGVAWPCGALIAEDQTYCLTHQQIQSESDYLKQKREASK